MAGVVWSPEALRELLSIRSYLAIHDPLAATSFEARLRKAGDSLRTFPNRGRPTAGGSRELVTVPPFVIRYEVLDEVVRILTVRHGRQSL